MRKIFAILAVAAVAVGCNNHRVVINGDILGVEDGTIYLAEPGRGGAMVDSTEVSSGKFVFNIDAPVAGYYALRTADEVISAVFTEDGTITVSGNVADNSVLATGTPANDAFNQFNADVTAFNQRYAQAADDEQREALREEYYAFIDKAIEGNMDNIFGVILFIEQKGYELSTAEMTEKLNALAEPMKELAVVKEALDKATRKMRTEPKAEGSDFTPTYINIEQPTPDGETVSLKSVVEKKGNKYVLLDFWASWCGPCMGEMPYLKEAYAKYSKKGFEIYGVSFDRNAEAWKGAIKKQNMKWVNVSLLESFNNPAAEEYVVESIPTNFLIDCSNGEIIAKNLRGEELIEKLESLF
ncbi:MAG: redoxin domain-containing protein [Rikenellaceae bacterium]|nr:redoxin domain-containing protein [Rikenellaceae bacterium]